MATEAQIAANRANSQHSTGPVTEAGREASKMNNFRHGLTGHAFILLDFESAEFFDELKSALIEEHNPQTPTEQILVEKMAQHHWLSQRAQYLLTLEISLDCFDPDVYKNAAAYTRYQALHDRLFQRALHDLLKLRAEKRKAEIGFESQKRAQAQETRRESEATRKQDLHKIKLATAETKLEGELIKTEAIKAAHVAPPQPEIEPKTRPIAA
jgi:hypothetical protein